MKTPLRDHKGHLEDEEKEDSFESIDDDYEDSVDDSWLS